MALQGYQVKPDHHHQAKKYLQDWYRCELTFIRTFREWKQNPIKDFNYLDSFCGALIYFTVIRRLNNIKPEHFPNPIDFIGNKGGWNGAGLQS